MRSASPSPPEDREAAVLLTLTLAFGFLVALAQVTAYDTWALLAQGRHVTRHGLPATDPFSYTAAERPWLNHSWLAQVLFYLAYDGLGRIGLIVSKCAVVTLTLGLVWAAARRRGAPAGPASAGTALCALAAAPWWHLRPQVFTYLAWACVVFLLVSWEAGRRRAILWLPPVMAAWVNLHAGFVLGLFGVGLWLAGNALARRLAPLDESGDRVGAWPSLAALGVAAGLAAVATLANPWGIHAFRFPLRMTTSSFALGASIDWYSPNFLAAPMLPALVLVALLLAGLAFAPARPRGGEGLVTLTLLLLALRSGRQLPLFAIAAAPLAAVLLQSGADALLARWPGLRSAGALGRGLLLLALVVGGGAVALAMRAPAENPFLQELAEARYPHEAIGFIRERRPPPPLFNEYIWAGYELWALPEYRVFIDNRFELFPEPVIRDYLDVAYATSRGSEVLARWGVRTVLAGRDSALAAALARRGGWTLVFAAREAVVLVRHDDPDVAAFLARLHGVHRPRGG